MSSRSEHTSRSWFNKSKSSSSKDSRQHLSTDKPSSSREASSSRSTGNPLNQLANAIGLKSKKQSNQGIQSPSFPSPASSLPPPPPSPLFKSRSKTDSTHSFQSPPDDRFDKSKRATDRKDARQSLLTISDDPFAANSIPTSVPPLPRDDNRLSAYSTSSLSEPGKFQSRGSFASSSSHSNYFSHETGPNSPTSSRTSTTDASVHKLTSKRSIGSLTRATSSTSSKWNEASSHFPSTMASKSPDFPTQRPRPQTRARGMTDSSFRPPPSDLVYPNVPPRPQPLVSPPTSPPPSHLPDPPRHYEATYNPGGRGASMSNHHTRSQQKSPEGQSRYHPPLTESTFLAQLEAEGDGEDMLFPQTPRMVQSSKPLKSMSSQQSLRASPSSSLTHQDHSAGPRKQRSFHRLHSHGPPPVQPPNYPPPNNEFELKRGTSSSGPVSPQRTRKRVFSGSSIRPSTSTGTGEQDDTRSITSLPSAVFRSPHSSFAAAGSHVMDAWPSDVSHQESAEFAPRNILSPQELKALEDSYAAENNYVRSRTTSIASASEYQSETSHDSPFLTSYGSKVSLPGGTSRLDRIPDSFSSSASINNAQTPPSRSRTLMPVPTPDAITGLVPLSPAPRKPIRKRPSAERAPKPEKAKSTKSARRRSIRKQPSFLDIHDDEETDKEEGRAITSRGAPMESSFLDLGRDSSFDTVRSD